MFKITPPLMLAQAKEKTLYRKSRQLLADARRTLATLGKNTVASTVAFYETITPESKRALILFLASLLFVALSIALMSTYLFSTFGKDLVLYTATQLSIDLKHLVLHLLETGFASLTNSLHAFTTAIAHRTLFHVHVHEFLGKGLELSVSEQLATRLINRSL